MKARVKATGEIVEISLSHIVYDNGKKIIWYNTPQGASFTEDELEFIDTKENFDYWEKLLHQYAGMAMQGMLANANHYLWERKQNSKSLVANAAELAHALVEKMKESV